LGKLEETDLETD